MPPRLLPITIAVASIVVPVTIPVPVAILVPVAIPVPVPVPIAPLTLAPLVGALVAVPAAPFAIGVPLVAIVVRGRGMVIVATFIPARVRGCVVESTHGANQSRAVKSGVPNRRESDLRARGSSGEVSTNHRRLTGESDPAHSSTQPTTRVSNLLRQDSRWPDWRRERWRRRRLRRPTMDPSEGRVESATMSGWRMPPRVPALVRCPSDRLTQRAPSP